MIFDKVDFENFDKGFGMLFKLEENTNKNNIVNRV